MTKQTIKTKVFGISRVLLLILFFGFILRTYKLLELFMYSHDQDLLSWFVKDIVQNQNLRLIGQETSVKGVFIGPLWYYLAIPFYLLFNMDPKGGLFLAIFVGVMTIASIYYVFTKVANRRVGLIGALLYATSFYSVMTDREVVPTTPTILWSVWAFYVIHLFLAKKYRLGFLLSGILVGLVWHVSMGLILIVPLFALALITSLYGNSVSQIKKQFGKPELKMLIAGAFFLILFLSPYFVFELRHNFAQTQSLLSSSSSEAVAPFSEKLDRTTTIASKNIIGFTWGPYIDLPNRYPLYLFMGIFAFLVYKQKITKKLGLFLSAWLIAFILFFSFNALNLSEYYLNGMLVVEVFILALFFDYLFSSKALRYVGIVLLLLFVIANLARLFSLPINHSGYLDRRALVQFIKEDAKQHGYPCVSVSYITEPGFNLGYRYLYYIEGMHVNQPSSEAPVYSIAFPHSRVDSIDKSFGALGLIYPDYSRYTKEGIEKSCAGENANETDPLFGYVQ